MIARIALGLVLAATAASAQIPDRPEKLKFDPITFQTPRAKDYQAKLKNAVPVFVASTGKDGTPLVRVTASWRGGSYLDPKGKEGLAALVGSQMVQGGNAKLDAAALDDRLEALAATLTGSCADTSCTLSLQVLEKDLDEGLDLLVQALTQPAFAQDRLDLAKRLANQRISRRNDDVNSIVGYQLGYLLYGDRFFATAGETRASLDAIAREDLVAMHARMIHPSNMVISAAGRADRKVLLDTLDRKLGVLAASKEAQVSPKVPVPDFPRTPGIYVTDKDAPQASVRWAFPGMRRTDPDWHAAFVMNQVLGGSGFTSR
jgi:zinc protease